MHPTPPVDASSLRLALFSDTFWPQVNGVARTLEKLVAAVEARGGVVRVYTADDEPAAACTDQVRRYPSRPFWGYPELKLSWPSYSRVLSDLRSFAPTLVHAATEFGVGLAGRRAARAVRAPLVTSYHTNFATYAAHYHLGFLQHPGWSYLRWFHSAARHTYCPTHAIAHDVERRGFSNVGLWSRGVDPQHFSPRFRSCALRQHVGADDETLVVAYVGRLAAEKGLRVGVEAMRRVHAARPGRVRFVAIGDGPLAPYVAQQAPPGSWLPGMLRGEALSRAYASADVFLFPSVTDTFGNVMLEAMASGLPVIGADVGPTREQVLPDRGWVMPSQDPQCYADALIAMVDDRAALHAKREAALTFALSKTWDAVWDRLISDYLALQCA